MCSDMLEKDIEARVVKYAKRNGYIVRKMNGAGANHWPDRGFWGPNNNHFFIEFKRVGGVLSPGQDAMISDLRGIGVVVYVCNDVGKGLAIIDAEAEKHGRKTY